MSSFLVMAEVQSATCQTTASHGGASANSITYSQVNCFSTSTSHLVAGLDFEQVGWILRGWVCPEKTH